MDAVKINGYHYVTLLTETQLSVHELNERQEWSESIDTADLVCAIRRRVSAPSGDAESICVLVGSSNSEIRRMKPIIFPPQRRRSRWQLPQLVRRGEK